MKLFPLAALTGIVVTIGATQAHGNTVVYQDNFDNDGIATNAGIGGGLARYARQGDTWVDDGTLNGNSTGANDRGNVYTINSIPLTGGFKLEVVYTINDVGNTNANRVNIGLIDKDSIPADQTDTTYVTGYLSVNQDRYGIGLNLTTDWGSQGLNFADDAGAGSVTLLSNEQSITTGTHTWILEVDATGTNWSYSIDGAAATTGTFPDGFDLSREYKFFGYVQDYRNNRIKIDSVTLTGAATSAPMLRISQSGGNLDFEWNSMPGMQYDLLSSTDLSTDPETWLPYDDGVNTYENLLANSLSGVVKDGPVRFFALREEPVAPLVVADFELDDGGFTVVDHSGGSGSSWMWGAPDSSSLGGSVTTGAGTPPSAKCWGTDINNPGRYLAGTDTSLISPVIDLTGVDGATLSFAQAIDILSPDALVVNIIDDDISGGISVIGDPLHTADDVGTTGETDWKQVSGLDLAAGVGQPVRIEFRFTGNATDGTYIGAYIDDFVVTPTAP